MPLIPYSRPHRRRPDPWPVAVHAHARLGPVPAATVPAIFVHFIFIIPLSLFSKRRTDRVTGLEEG